MFNKKYPRQLVTNQYKNLVADKFMWPMPIGPKTSFEAWVRELRTNLTKMRLISSETGVSYHTILLFSEGAQRPSRKERGELRKVFERERRMR